MKTIQISTVANSDSAKSNAKQISKKTIFISALVLSSVLSILFIEAFIVFCTLAVTGTVEYCWDVYQDIATLDFSSDEYSITLEEIIEDLEG